MEETNVKKWKGKRKNGKSSFVLQKVKKFGVQGKLGKGFEIDNETYNYFLRVLELCQKNEFDTDEEKTAFIENSLSQTEGKEVSYSSNQMTSRVLELLLNFVLDEELILKFASAFTPSLRMVSTDPFASFVLEKLLEIISLKFEDNKSLTKWLRKTSQFVLNNYEDFVFDHFGNRVMRRVLQVLSKTTHLFPKKQFVTIKANPLLTKETPIESKEPVKKNIKILTKFATDFFNWPQFNDLFQKELTSGFVQVLLKTLQCSQKEEIVAIGVEKISKVLQPLEGKLFSNDVYLHSLEAAVSASTEQNYTELYETFLKGKSNKFVEHPIGNFTLGKFIRFAPTKEIVEELFEELNTNNGFELLFKSEFYSIFVDFAEALKRLKVKQTQLVEVIAKFVKADESKQNFLYGIATWKNSARDKAMRPSKANENDAEGKTTKFTTELSGTLLIQRFLEFHKPVKIVQSFLSLNRNELLKLGTDPKAAYVFCTFFNSPTVGEKNKEKLLINIKDIIPEFSMNKFGSRIIDVIWDLKVLKYREIITGQLVEKQGLVNANQFGTFIVQRACIHIFKRDKKAWAATVMMTKNTEKEDFVKSLIAQTKRKAKEDDRGSEGEQTEKIETNPKKKRKRKNEETD